MVSPAGSAAFTPTRQQIGEETGGASWKSDQHRLLGLLTDARMVLLEKFPFWGHLAMRLDFVLTDQVEGVAVTADRTCYFNPHFIERLDPASRAYVIAHEVGHVAFGHFNRAPGHDPVLWNEACDHMLNLALKRAGLTIPPEEIAGRADPRFTEMSDEQIYAVIREEREEGRDAQPQPAEVDERAAEAQDRSTAEGGERGGARDSTSGPERGGWGTDQGDCDFARTEELKNGNGERSRVPTAQALRDEVVAAAQAHERKAGRLPAGVARLVEQIRSPQIPWDLLLARHIDPVLREGSTYRRPSRRSVALRDHLRRAPGVSRRHSPVLPGPAAASRPAVLVFDTSGSMSDETVAECLAEASGILAAYDMPVRVIACDSEVWVDEDVRWVGEIALRGGGGSSTVPAFDHLGQEPGPWGEPTVVIYFTDMMTRFPEQPPDFPVIWVDTGRNPGRPEPPFGEVVRMHPESCPLPTSRERISAQLSASSRPSPARTPSQAIRR